MSFEPELIQRIAVMMPALLLSLSVHEYAHAWTATLLGDATPRLQGRLTLSPMSHIDPIGTLMFPLMMLLLSGGQMFFGYAKPVQFNPNNFTRRISTWQGSALAAAAGPLANIGLALLALLALRGLAMAGLAQHKLGFDFLTGLFSLNIMLAVFNLMPLPPLDGSYLLPRSMDGAKEWLTRYSMMVFLLVFFLPIPGLGTTLGQLVTRPLTTFLGRILQAVAFAGA